MSPLWPEVIKIGLFSDHCVLRRGKVVLRRECPLGADFTQLLKEVGAMFGELKSFNRFAKAEIYISDDFGRTVLMPWQNKIDSHAQLQTYGRACLEGAVAGVAEEWTSYAGFRHHAAAGIVTALPAGALHSLLELLAVHRVKIQSILPLSAAVYWYHKSDRKTATSVLWLEEASRITAFSFRSGVLRSIDVEPVLRREGAIKRLLNRLTLSHGTVTKIHYWSTSKQDTAIAVLESLSGEAVIEPVSNARWSVA